MSTVSWHDLRHRPDDLPPSSQPVLAIVFTRVMAQMVIAMRCARFDLAALKGSSENLEYDKERDRHCVPEGWYQYFCPDDSVTDQLVRITRPVVAWAQVPAMPDFYFPRSNAVQ